MKPDPTNLLKSLGISNSIIGFYDTPEKGLFEPFTTAEQCIFSCYQDWMQGKSLCLLANKSFLHKSFWNNVKQARFQSGKVTQPQEV